MYDDETIDIPDEHGNITRYIAKNCGEDEIPYGLCHGMECNTDSDCLSNKCVSKHCVNNEEEPIIHCDDIYTLPRFIIKESSYMHCGSALGYQCQVNDECSSKDCDNTCSLQPLRLPYFEGSTSYVPNLFTVLLMFMSVFAFSMGLTICCCRQFTKESNK
ncbi:hypothetical protein H8356DRAFT_1410299 [Neocallimastix lanati (nom. inval.)]|nr:hypothetical protein H8356DRAFT_1410299 [Neocallimastix sp. JGI-2020a]